MGVVAITLLIVIPEPHTRQAFSAMRVRLGSHSGLLRIGESPILDNYEVIKPVQ
jgi:hypothetical protein